MGQSDIPALHTDEVSLGEVINLEFEVKLKSRNAGAQNIYIWHKRYL